MVAPITGITTTSMIAVELIRRSRSAEAIGPCGSNMPAGLQEARRMAAHTAGQRSGRKRQTHCRGLAVLFIELGRPPLSRSEVEFEVELRCLPLIRPASASRQTVPKTYPLFSNVCGNWLILKRQELLGRAAWCDRSPDHSSPLVLFAEEFDPRDRPAPGELRQAFSHLALVDRLFELWKRSTSEAGVRMIVSELRAFLTRVPTT